MAEANLYFIQFGTGLCFLLCLVELMHSGRRTTGAFWVALVLGSIQLRFGLYAAGLLVEHPSTVFAFMSSVFCMGPLVLYFAGDVLEYDFFGRQKVWYHFVPAAVVLVIEIYFAAFVGNENVSDLIHATLYAPELRWPALVLVAACLHELVYFGYAGYGFLTTNHRYELHFSATAISMVSIPVVAIALCVVGLLLRANVFYHVGASMFTVTMMLAFIYGTKGPTLLNAVRREIRLRKYANSQLDSLDVEELKERLTQLVEADRVYTQEDLTIHALADQLGISYKQLSELLNGVYAQNFAQFINSYRIGMARELLLRDKQTSILTVAFRVGFSSKATFNAQFKNIVGVTPSAFRKRG